MYLLNLVGLLYALKLCAFTFHYVSIKSSISTQVYSALLHLHSTMYLLNQQVLLQMQQMILNLHSTMYLLNPDAHSGRTHGNIFTFHYVSIKSVDVANEIESLLEFTFHYVSIKSVNKCNQGRRARQFTFHYVSIKSILYYFPMFIV